LPGSGLFSWFFGDRQGESHSIWSHDGHKTDVRIHGEVVLTDDDSDIKSLSPGGYVTITERTGLFNAVTFESRSVNGKIERTWSGLDGDAERRTWLADHLLALVRNSGFAAEARVARILKQAGPDGVLQEISRLTSDYVKRVYIQRLLVAAPLDDATLSRLIAQVGREMHSAYDIASVLSGLAPRLREDSTRIAYLQAVRAVNSDYDRRRALSALMQAGALSPAVVTALLDAATAIRSDYDIAGVLTELLQSNDVTDASRQGFVAALDTIQSDYERRRVLTALADRATSTPAVLTVVYSSASRMRSDYDLASVLADCLRRHPLDPTLRPAFFAAFAGLKSDYERHRVLSLVLDDARTDNETVLAVLHASTQIQGSYDRAALLCSIAQRHQLQGPARDAYLAAARGISSRYEQDRALAAITRSEMR
jgi:hypothetical protein